MKRTNSIMAAIAALAVTTGAAQARDCEQIATEASLAIMPLVQAYARGYKSQDYFGLGVQVGNDMSSGHRPRFLTRAERRMFDQITPNANRLKAEYLTHCQ